MTIKYCEHGYPVSNATCPSCELAARDAEIERLKKLWLPCDQTVQCALCLWVDWDYERNGPHSDDCPLGYITNRLRSLERENAELRRDAERWRYVRGVHLRSHGPHMDGTCGYSFRGLLNGLHRSADDAVDAAMANGL